MDQLLKRLTQEDELGNGPMTTVRGFLKHLGVAGFLLVSVLVALASNLAAQVKPEAALFKLRVGGFGLETMTSYPILIAQQKGLFAQEGLAVSYTRSYEQMPALIGGSFDVIDDGADSSILVADKGGDIVIVYDISRKPNHFMVLGPGVNSAEELEGKTVGVWKIPSTDQMLVKNFLGKKNINVTLLRVGGSRDRFAALQAGRISAATLTPDFAYPAQQQGMKILATPLDWGVYPFTQVVFKKQWAEAHPDIVAKYIRSIHRAIKWLQEKANFEEAARLVSKAGRTDIEAARWMLQVVLKEDIYNLEKPQASVLQLAADWLLSEKFLTKPFNAASVIDARYYERAIK